MSIMNFSVLFKDMHLSLQHFKFCSLPVFYLYLPYELPVFLQGPVSISEGHEMGMCWT